MPGRLVTCKHCGGKRMCVKSGGKSCRACLDAAGFQRRQWATVRCSYCGGLGKMVEPVEEPAPEATQSGESPAEETAPGS